MAWAWRFGKSKTDGAYGVWKAKIYLQIKIVLVVVLVLVLEF